MFKRPRHVPKKRSPEILPKRNRLKREKPERIPPIEEVEDMLRLALARMAASLLAGLPAHENNNLYTE